MVTKEKTAETKTTEVSTTTTSDALAKMANSDIYAGFIDAAEVAYDGPASLKAVQGGFYSEEELVGKHLTIGLMSLNPHFVCSPNDMKAPIDLVVYSKHRDVSEEGVNLDDHLEMLKNQGYERASVSERLQIVGELSASDEKTNLVNEIVQIDLPPTGVRAFRTYKLQKSWAIARGLASPESAAIVKLTAKVAKTRSGEIYTKIGFEK